MADSNSTSFGSVFASGIQDVAAVAAVLGTDICDKNAGLPLTKGYLFPAACGRSMFGVLGLAKHTFKSFLPLHIAENLGIEIEKFDTYRMDKAMINEMANILAKRNQLFQNPNVKVYIYAYSYSKHTWIPALIPCFLLSCVNFIPYIPHYRTFYARSEDSPDSSDSYLYFPLILTFSSFVASFICWFDAAIMLSSSPSPYPVAGPFMGIFTSSRHFGSLFARHTGYVIGILAAVGIVIGYISSYLVVQKMIPTDTYYWLGLELTLRFLRLVIWSWNTEMDDLESIELLCVVDRSDEEVIRQIRELPLHTEQAEEVFSRLKVGGCFIQSKIVDTYYQAKYSFHDVCIEDINGISAFSFVNSWYAVLRTKPMYYIMWNDQLRYVDKFLVASGKVGLVIETQKFRGLRLYARYYVRISWKVSDLYYLEETDLEPLGQEQISNEDQEKLRTREHDIYVWIDTVNSCKLPRLGLEEEEVISSKFIHLEDY